MFAIRATVKPDDSGNQVANLQAALLFLLDRDVTLFFDPLKTPPPDELKGIREALLVETSTMLFDQTTRVLTVAFQQRGDLFSQDQGVVDQTTADALNDRLRQLGGLDDDKTLTVKGRVRRAGIDEPQPGVQVRVVAVDANGETALGETETDNNGIYHVEFLASLVHAAPGGAATDKAIIARAFRPDGSEMGAARWAGAVQALMVLDVVVAVGEYLVQGRVTDTRGRPQAGLKVVAFDRDLRKHQQLGEATTTNAVGDYAITYGLETFPSADGKAPLAPDVFVMVFLEDGMEPLGVSSTRFQARQVETIDVEIPVLAKEPSEFERVTALVMPLLVGQGTPREVFGAGVADPIPTDLQPQELNADDVEFIVRETELDAAAIQAWAESSRWRQEALRLIGADAQPSYVDVIEAHGWPFFFAWIRAGQSPGLMGVLRSEVQAWISVQRNGEALTRIPPVERVVWGLLVSALTELASLAAVDDTLNSGDPLVEMLRQSPYALPRELKIEVLAIFRAQGLDNPDAFLKLADWDPSEAKALGAFVRTLRLNDLTGGHRPLIGALNSRLSDAGDSIEPLADMGQQAWLKLVLDAAGADLADERSALASLAACLQWRMEQLHPLPALKARLDDNSVYLADPELGKLRSVMDEHPVGAEALLNGKNMDSPAVNAIDNVKAVEILRNFGRFGQLGLGFEGAGLLFTKGITSLALVAQHDPDHLRSLLQYKWPQEMVNAFLNNVTNAIAEG